MKLLTAFLALLLLSGCTMGSLEVNSCADACGLRGLDHIKVSGKALDCSCAKETP